MIRRPPRSTLFPTRRSSDLGVLRQVGGGRSVLRIACFAGKAFRFPVRIAELPLGVGEKHRNRGWMRSEEHTSELQSQSNLVCRLLLEKKKDHTQCTSHISQS